MADSGAATLLVELGCEELPPRDLPHLAGAFFDGVRAGLEQAGIRFRPEDSDCLYTPRRLALRLAGVSDRQPDRQQDRRGPSVSAAFDDQGQPTPAATGFAASVGLPVDALERLETDKGEWLFARVDIVGQALADILFPILAEALDKLPVPRPMRWADHEYRFIRPVHWLVVLHGEQTLEGELYGCRAGRETRGHRVHAPGPHRLGHADDYLETLQQACVEADPDQRRRRVRQQAEAAGEALGGRTRIDDALLEEVSNLLEWPVAVSCAFEAAFLQVPPEALIASMESHQKFFPILDSGSGDLTPGFIALANIESTDPAAVREGFERVIRPRLADARFFWEQDLKTPLADRLPALDQVIFQQDLGSVGDKSRRVARLSREIATLIEEAPEAAERAALLSKCDLVSLMVGEFPELQGVMGAHYARAGGESPAVSEAIGEHYRPAYSGDAIPTGTAGRIVSLADRLDTLVGIIAAGLKPTGNKDPYALRRAALGILRILLEGAVPLGLKQLLELAGDALKTQFPSSAPAREEARTFLNERLRQHLRSGTEATTRQISAVMAVPAGTLVDLQSRLEAVVGFMRSEQADSLVAANKRIGNILDKAGSRDGDTINEDLLEIGAETELFETIVELEQALQPLFESADYAQALSRLAALKPPVDAYFDRVMVMDEDPAIRANRLNLLARLKALFDRVADFSLAA